MMDLNELPKMILVSQAKSTSSEFLKSAIGLFCFCTNSTSVEKNYLAS